MLSGTVKILDDQAIILIPTPSDDPKGKSARLYSNLVSLTPPARSLELAKMEEASIGRFAIDMYASSALVQPIQPDN